VRAHGGYAQNHSALSGPNNPAVAVPQVYTCGYLRLFTSGLFEATIDESTRIP
jgi:hypothetical protein